MPMKPPRICPCGYSVPSATLCLCQTKRAAERKQRHDAKRPNASDRGYDSKWRAERIVYLKANPTCRRCSAPATVVDHIQPHKGNRQLFWNRSNWQPLCSHCHSVAKQAQERRAAS